MKSDLRASHKPWVHPKRTAEPPGGPHSLFLGFQGSSCTSGWLKMVLKASLQSEMPPRSRRELCWNQSGRTMHRDVSKSGLPLPGLWGPAQKELASAFPDQHSGCVLLGLSSREHIYSGRWTWNISSLNWTCAVSTLTGTVESILSNVLFLQMREQRSKELM